MPISKQSDSIQSKFGLSIVIPVYNEVDNIVSLCEEVSQVLRSLTYPYEIIVVDDGSTDGTAAQVAALKDKLTFVRLVRHKKNSGQSIALVTGIRAAAYLGIVTLDGDGQNDPADIPHLLSHWHNLDVVVLGHRQRRHDQWTRKFSSWVGNGVRKRWLKDDCPDTGCSLKLFSRDAFLELPHFNHLHRFLPALFARAGFTVINVPVNHRPRLYGVSKYGVMNRLFVGIYDLFGVRWLLNRPCQAEVIDERE